MSARLLLVAVAAGLGAAGFLPPVARAHGLVGRQDLPIPEWLFGWAAAVVLVVSFVALAVLWPDPRLERHPWRPLRGGAWRVPASRPVEWICGAFGVFLFAVVIWAGLVGEQTASGNLAPTFIYVTFWLGLVPLSVLFGDVFRAFNPWRAIGRAVAGAARLLTRGPLPEPLPYPERLGRWPAAAGLAGFTWLELVYSSGDSPRTLAIAALAYSAITFLGMALYGIETWIQRAEAFSVYFNLFARISPFERREGQLGVRWPLSGLTRLDPQPGTVAVIVVMIGSVSFDGLAEGKLWSNVAPELSSFFTAIGLSAARALELSFTIGLLASILVVYCFYRAGIAGVRRVGGETSGADLARAFAHALVPIALVYAAAHYVTLLLFQGQAIAFLASDPLGRDWDLFGTADRSIDYGLMSATTAWYVQVGLVVSGHVGGLVLAHDRALALYRRAKVAVQSQYWMLAVMVGFTSLALWLLSEANS